MEQRRYYEAYDDRYRQVHSRGLQWASDTPTPIVSEVISRFGIGEKASLLEIGCGEGRDAGSLLKQGFRLLATDISPTAVAWCRNRFPEFSGDFQVLDCLKDRLDAKFDFIYAVAVLHMLVRDQDRQAFFAFFRQQLREGGIGLICTMGDGEWEASSEISDAFRLQERTHQQTGTVMAVAGTSCRMVSRKTLTREITESGLNLLEMGLTASEPDFSQMIYAVITR